MVFACKKCGSRYRLDISLFDAKALRVTCRKCGQVHIIRSSPSEGENVVVVEGPSATEIDRTGSRPIPRASTIPPISRPTTTTVLPSIPSKRTIEMSATMVSEVSPLLKVEDIWFAIRKGQRIGPFTKPALEELLRNGTLHERSFVWRPTMEAWKRLNEVPELASVLSSYREWTQRERTVVEPIPAPAPPVMDDIPPIPADASRPSSTTAVQQEPHGNLVDNLFSEISHPAFDLRKASEVQPDEPPLTVSSRRPSASKVSETLDESSEHIFFASDPSPQAATAPVREFPLERPAPPRPSTSLQEFSLLIRLDKRSRRKALIAIAGTGGVLLAVIGTLLAFAVVEPEVAPSLSIETQAAETPVVETQTKQKSSFRTDYAPAPPLETWLPKSSQRRTDSNPQGSVSVFSMGPSQNEPVPLGKIDENVKAEFNKYAELLKKDDDKPEEVRVDVKPKTITEMPNKTFTKAGIDSFMNSKIRKFLECKNKMSRPSAVPVKVVLSFIVNTDGRISELVIEKSGTRDEGLEKCIRRIVSDWAFPAQDEPSLFKTTLLL